MTWFPHVTVATVIEADHKFLLVKERLENGDLVYNQPAGHLEPSESIVEAAARETLEETAWQVKVDYLIGIQLYQSTTSDVTYLRFCFSASPLKHYPKRKLDTCIVSAHWLALEEVLQKQDQLRSPMVMDNIQQYLDGKNYPLELLNTLND